MAQEEVVKNAKDEHLRTGRIASLELNKDKIE